jgi:hypothetical protein
VKTFATGTKTTLTVLTIIVVPLSASVGMMILKAIQMFDYLNFINVEIPSNVKTFTALFETNLLNFMPNLFEQKKYDMASGSKKRLLIEVGNQTKTCKVSFLLTENEMSCYMLNSIGDLMLHFLAYFALRMLLSFLMKVFNVAEYRQTQKEHRKRNMIFAKQSVQGKGVLAQVNEEIVKRDSSTCKFQIAKFLMWADNLMNVEFFVTTVIAFQLDFLLAVFANLRFLSSDGLFGTINFAICIVALCIYLGVVAVCLGKYKHIE